MGSMALRGMVEAASLDTALDWHLRFNHFPPVPSSMVGPCKRAIANAKRGMWDRKVRLPEGVTWRGQKSAPTWSVMEAHHLDGFLPTEEDPYGEE